MPGPVSQASRSSRAGRSLADGDDAQRKLPSGSRRTLSTSLLGCAGQGLGHVDLTRPVRISSEDILFTRRMAAAGEVVGVRLIDHLVLGSGGRWVSLRQEAPW
jgi:hypothetical protein